MKLVDPKWTKEIEEKYKVREENTHYERSNWEVDNNGI